jgi:hypothetical protein
MYGEEADVHVAAASMVLSGMMVSLVGGSFSSAKAPAGVASRRIDKMIGKPTGPRPSSASI